MKCGIHVYVCHDALSMQCLYALLDLSWCGTAQNTERRTLVSHTVYTCTVVFQPLTLSLTADGTITLNQSTACSFPNVGRKMSFSKTEGRRKRFSLWAL